MAFSSIGKFLTRTVGGSLAKEAATALAIEAGGTWLRNAHPALFSRTRLVSVKKGVLHAFVTSAAARQELSMLKEPLFKAMESVIVLGLRELRIDIRGSLAEES